jgi:soluble lytic murein transglycosylase
MRAFLALTLAAIACTSCSGPRVTGPGTSAGGVGGPSGPGAASSTPPPLGTAPPTVRIDLDSVKPVLADPRLSVALARVEARDYLAAIQILDVGLTTLPPGAPETMPWTYQLARLSFDAKNDEQGFALLGKVARSDYALAPYARFALAKEAVRRGKLDEGNALLADVPADLGDGRELSLLRAEIAERKSRCDVALPLLRAHLASSAKPSRWPEVTTRAVRCLLAPGVTPEAAEEALTLARRVTIGAPTSSFAGTATSQIALALAALPPDRRSALAGLSWEQEADRARAYFDAGQTSAAVKAAKTLESTLPETERRGPAGCKVALLEANIAVKARKRPRAADGFQAAIDRCTGEDRIVALFQGGKASRSAGRAPEAAARFALLEAEAPTHRLADDARLRGAEAARLANDEPGFVKALEKFDEAYPKGDMVSDALFTLALHRIGKNDWAGALETLERAEKARPRERDYRAAGRTTYFRGRALAALGKRDEAISAYQHVVRDYPFTYYMLLAHARLSEIDPALAAAARTEGEGKTDPDALTVPDLPALHTPAFARAVELVRQGQNDEAKQELASLGLYGADAAPSGQWIAALLFGNAGAVTLSHAVPRSKLAEWFDHYPTGAFRKAWEIAYPRPYLTTVEDETKRSQIPLSLAYAIMREESAFDPAVASPAKAFGLMQLILPTAKSMASRRGIPVSVDLLRTPGTNVALGCQYLGMLRGRFPECPMLAIPSYNAGPGAPERWLRERPGEELDLFVERIPYDETRNYTKRVLGSYAAYLALYEPARLDEVLRLPLHPRALAVAVPPTSGEDAPAAAPDGATEGGTDGGSDGSQDKPGEATN